MQIYGPAALHGPHNIQSPHNAYNARPATPTPTSRVNTADQLDLSPAAQFIDAVNSLPDIRQDRVSALRQAIASGTYETADKLDSALSALLDEIG